ncbi:MAG: MBL fold metallo-hydrolase [Leptolyngbyaceae cyanobacterium SM2_5_2]|nr:MBL fold metallo-hydrolase [Leptolyngbyaceae cyanobacterium SM2_5_2]
MKQLYRWSLGLLLALFTLVGIVSLQTQGLAQDSAESTLPTLEAAGLSLEELADGIYGLIASTDFPPQDPMVAICNGGIIIGNDGVVVVDPFHNKALGNLLLQTAATLTDQPVRYVINTHYHFDHTGGNPAASAQNLPILGRGPIREFMLTRNSETDPQVTPPEVIINGAWEVWLGDRQVQVREFDGHSGGTDLIVYIPDADVLMLGDLLFNQRIPYVGDGHIRTWQATLQELKVAYPTATLLPGHGPVTSEQGIETLLGFLNDLEALALGWQANGVTAEEAKATPIPDVYKDFLFQGLFPIALETAYQQITLGQDDATAMQAYLQAQSVQP